MKKYRIRVEDAKRFYPQVRKWFLFLIPYWEDCDTWFGTETDAINYVQKQIKAEINAVSYIYNVGYGSPIVATDRTVEPGSIWKHFKGTTATVIEVVKNSETNEDMVLYRCTGNKRAKTNHKDGTYVRPLNMFLSEVDHDKYPTVIQKYRFEKVLK